MSHRGDDSDPGIRVLHVDDDPGLLELSARFLERATDRLSVATESDPVRALERLSTESVDCLVSDYQMPELNGLELLDAVHDRYPTLPFVFFTGCRSEMDVSDVFSRGATDVLEKNRPAEQYELLAHRVVDAVERARARRELSERERNRSGNEAPFRNPTASLNGASSPTDEIADHVAVGVCTCTDEGRVTYANDAFASLIDRDSESLRWTDLREHFDGLESDAFDPEAQRRLEIEPKLGEDGADERVLSVTITPVEPSRRERGGGPNGPNDRTASVLTCEDVTERVAYEHDSHLLEALFEQIPAHLYVKDEAARHVRISNEYPNPDEVIGKTDVEVYGAERGTKSYERDLRIVDTGEPMINVVEGNPETHRYFLSSKVPWRNDDGEIKGLIGITRDITERKRHQRQLERQNDRLRTVASVISHDIRNPLNLASGKLQLLEDECGIESVHLSDAQHSLDRTHDLLESLLSLVKHGQWVAETDPVSVETVTGLCWRHVAAGAGVLELDQEFYVVGDEDRLLQLFENLFRNAALHAGSDVTIRVGPLEDWSGFYVEDDGPGIPADERERVFESGYTTSTEGTGFGIPIIEVIAEAHGWDVRLTDGRTGGARFEFVGVDFYDPT
ncbi:hybrid sensor histidine kinase/response regulator [Halomontanus rarus]|uniref:hybrid sensor histidine kinase/response regulator n=1 Tax=Halomontanus rarus TaxID=3034020 RepID=UPI0023E8B7E6|nr:PAS domain-containing protein [Halovivax sp. TS33]